MVIKNLHYVQTYTYDNPRHMNLYNMVIRSTPWRHIVSSSQFLSPIEWLTILTDQRRKCHQNDVGFEWKSFGILFYHPTECDISSHVLIVSHNSVVSPYSQTKQKHKQQVNGDCQMRRKHVVPTQSDFVGLSHHVTVVILLHHELYLV